MSSAFDGGVESRGRFSEDNAHPITPAAMTTASAPMYWSTIFARVAGRASTNEVRRGRRGFDSALPRGERIDSLLASGCLRKYRIWNMSAESATMKYADKMMTEGRRPPHMALLSAHSPTDWNYPKKEKTSPKNQMMMKFSARASPLTKISLPRWGEKYQKRETYDFVR